MCFLSSLFCNTSCRSSMCRPIRMRNVDAGGRESCACERSSCPCPYRTEQCGRCRGERSCF
ncbi:MAG: hypothetical protein IKU65_04825 [Oscillospiraceae bacterium]|nr:hypothetical protein [Oscillospiraceae bacterium]